MRVQAQCMKITPMMTIREKKTVLTAPAMRSATTAVRISIVIRVLTLKAILNQLRNESSYEVPARRLWK